MSNIWILIIAGSTMFIVIGGLSFLSHHYTLNGIKSRTVGDGQHGTARWATEAEVKKTYVHVPFNVSSWRHGHNRPTEQGLILGSTGGKNHVTALVDNDDIHCLMIGASGIGKTAFFLYPNLEYVPPTCTWQERHTFDLLKSVPFCTVQIYRLRRLFAFSMSARVVFCHL